MKIISYTLFLSLFFSTSLLAQDKGVQVHVIDPNIDREEINSRYHVTTQPIEVKNLPVKSSRDAVLLNFSEAKDWDELQKDIFYMDLKHKSITQLMTKYPKISKKKLEKLQELTK